MLDNVRFHHCKKTLKLITNTCNNRIFLLLLIVLIIIQLKLITNTCNNYIFTPPYSPNNNTIEVVFSIIKNKFKKMKKYNIKIKPLIIISINKLTETEKSYKDIFERSINYDYKDIEKKLRDKLIIKK